MVAADSPLPAVTTTAPAPLTRTSIDPPALSCPLASPTARCATPPGGDAFAAFQPWLASALGVASDGGAAAARALAALDAPRLPPGATPCIAVYGCADAPCDVAGRAVGLADLVASAGLLGGGDGRAAKAPEPPAPALLALFVDGPGAVDWAALASAAAAASASSTGSRAWCAGAACPPCVPALIPRALHCAAPAGPPGSVLAGVLAGGDGLVRLASAPTDDGGGPPSDGPPPFWCRDGSPTPHPAWARQARADAVTFLRARALETAPGGLLLIVTPGAMGAVCAGAGALDAVRDAAAAAAADGHVDRCLLDGFRAPLYFYEARDLEAAASSTGEWAVLQRGAVTLPSLVDDFKAGALSADAYGAAVAAAGRALVGPPLRAALGLDDAAMDALFARAAALVAARPDRYPVRNAQAAVLLRRRGGGGAGAGAGAPPPAAAAPRQPPPSGRAGSRWAGRLWPPVADAWASRRRSTDI